MNAVSLRAILLAHKTSDEACVRAIIESSSRCDEKVIEDAFTVALRTGALDGKRARRLLAIIESLAGKDSTGEGYFDKDSELLLLKEEMDHLTKQRRLQESANSEVADLQNQLRRLGAELQAYTSETASLDNEIAEMNSQMERLEIIVREVQ